jgi:hypothetical protein
VSGACLGANGRCPVPTHGGPLDSTHQTCSDRVKDYWCGSRTGKAQEVGLENKNITKRISKLLAYLSKEVDKECGIHIREMSCKASMIFPTLA